MPLFKRTLSEFLFRRFMLKHYGSNMLVDMQLEAKADSVGYIREHMAKVPYFEKHRDLVKFTLSQVHCPGLFLEFGVGRGKSMRWLATETQRTVHGFDSFDGIPEYWNGNPAGTFARRKLPKVPDNVILHVGLFDQTIEEFSADNHEPIAFLHVDCDLYSSTRTVFDRLGDRLQSDAIILFDEYFNFPRWRDCEFRAFQEFVAEQGVAYEYIGFSVTGQQVAVRIVENPGFKQAAADNLSGDSSPQ
jgi:predicted O-methyltransferase YrrM